MHSVITRSLARSVTAVAVGVGVSAFCAAAHAQLQEVPRTNSSLYYRMGGGSPSARAANPSAASVKLGVGGALKLNYSCGKFDVGLSWSTLMNGFASLGTTVTGAVKAGISSLPLYILQRAQPGLYELFQTYSKKADVAVGAALQTCEQMEAQIKAGNDPYAQWMGLAKGEGWKVEANTPTSDLVAAKTSIDTTAGRKGLTWIGGKAAGGALQVPIRPLNDVAIAGYNLALNVPVTSSNTMDYSSTKLPLPNAFRTPQLAADFATQVLGDQTIGLCNDPDCPAKGSQSGTGLLPKYEAEVPAAQAQVTAVMASSTPSYTSLELASAPGVTITAELVRSMRDLPSDIQSIATQRLAREIALARTIDKALFVRNLLVTGLTLPEVEAADVGKADVQRRVTDLNRYIDDLMFESRVRKEIVSSTSTILLQAYQASKTTSTATNPQSTLDPAPVIDGRVK